MDENDQVEQRRQYLELIRSQQTLLLSTVSAQGAPECSYAPYVRDQSGIFYIFVSELATHTKNMRAKTCASVLFIQSEKEVQNLFARERVVFECKVSEVKPEEDRYQSQLQMMEEQLGETVALLRSLPDFHLLALRPVRGKYIAGFGRAFSIDVADGTLSQGISR